MQFQQPFADDQPQPQKQGVAGIAEILVEPAHDVDISLLNDVGCVDPCLKPAVKSQLHHPAQPSPVPSKNLVQRSLVPGTGLFQEAGCYGGVVHQGPLQVLTPEAAAYWTG